MAKRILATVLVLCALAGWLAAQGDKPGTPAKPSDTTTSKPIPAQNPPEITTSPGRITTTVNLVNVPLTVTDKRNRLVIMMTKDDFNLFEDGKQQNIEYFSRETATGPAHRHAD